MIAQFMLSLLLTGILLYKTRLSAGFGVVPRLGPHLRWMTRHESRRLWNS
jgi:hypothetical protein